MFYSWEQKFIPLISYRTMDNTLSEHFPHTNSYWCSKRCSASHVYWIIAVGLRRRWSYCLHLGCVIYFLIPPFLSLFDLYCLARSVIFLYPYLLGAQLVVLRAVRWLSEWGEREEWCFFISQYLNYQWSLWSGWMVAIFPPASTQWRMSKLFMTLHAGFQTFHWFTRNYQHSADKAS